MWRKLKEMIKKFRADFAGLVIAILCAGLIIAGAKMLQEVFAGSPMEESVPYMEFLQYAKEGKIESISFSQSEKTVRFEFKDGFDRVLPSGDKRGKQKGDHVDADTQAVYITDNPKYEDFKKDMLEMGIGVKEQADHDKIMDRAFMLFMLLVLVAVNMKIGGVGDGIKKGKKTGKKVTFHDVAGLAEVKRDLVTAVDFIKSPEKYEKAGAKLPKGILLYGPPGTGKTLLAKAVAGDADVGFIATSGSEFEERFVGVGAQRIRKLFADAKKKAPCIIFIDEIDSIGRRRDNDGADYRQSINQLLNEMDGYSTTDQIMVIAATNRLEDLDPALVRPGRFDSQFAVPLPQNLSERKEIINIYMANKKAGEDFDADLLAKETLGCSPADIEAVINEASILAAGRHNGIITKEDIDDAFYRQVMHGHKKKDMERKQEEIRLAAFHEAAHAVIGILLGFDVTKATIIPSTSGAGGVTFFNNEKMGLFSVEELENKVVSLYAGRVAEELVFGIRQATTGASSDITEATKIIRQMVENFGMSKCGMLDAKELDMDRKLVYAEEARISDMLYQKTWQMVTENKECLSAVAEKLVEQETLTGDEVRSMLEAMHCSFEHENGSANAIMQKPVV